MGTNTSNIGLYKPTSGETGWAALVNANCDSLDSLAGAGVVLRTASTKFPSATVLGSLSSGLLRNTNTTGVLSIAIAGTDFYAPGYVVAVADGGTGLGTTPLNGELLIGNGTGYTKAALTGGTGITITNGAGSITIDATGASAAGGVNTQVQYNSGGSLAGDTGMTTDGAGNVSLVSLSLGTDLPLTEGGTGASTAGGARTNLGLGSMATQNSGAVAITGGSITGITQLAIADGGTGAGDAATARVNLGLGTMAVQNAATVAITGGSVTGITDLLVTDGGLNSSTVPLAGQIPMGTGGASYAPAHITAGTGISITNGPSSITIDSTVTSGEANTASNVGVGTGLIFKQKTGVDLEIKSLIQGANITITNNASDITIASTAGGSQHIIQDEGVSLTARSKLNFVGSGVTVTDGGAGPDSSIVTIVTTPGSAHVIQEEGSSLTQRSFLNFIGAGITVTDGGGGPDSTLVTVTSVDTASNVGAGAGTIFKQKTAVDLEFKTIQAGTGIAITNNASEVVINSTATGRSYTYALMGG